MEHIVTSGLIPWHVPQLAQNITYRPTKVLCRPISGFWGKVKPTKYKHGTHKSLSDTLFRYNQVETYRSDPSQHFMRDLSLIFSRRGRLPLDMKGQTGSQVNHRILASWKSSTQLRSINNSIFPQLKTQPISLQTIIKYYTLSLCPLMSYILFYLEYSS